MEYKIESIEIINNFTVTNYVPDQVDVNMRKHILMILYNTLSNDNECIDIKVKDGV